jgi:hypothetical protein
MGVDISGMNPIIRSPKPAYPDWNTATEEEKDTYFEVSNKWEKENPGDYFRSNWWGWRPIVMLCEHASYESELDIDFSNWGSNDGAGLDNQEECDKLADALQDIIRISTELEEPNDTIYLNLGSWTDMGGSFLDAQAEQQLNEQYQLGEVLYGSVVREDGSIVRPSHSANLTHVQNFINFLRECGGFEIW